MAITIKINNLVGNSITVVTPQEPEPLHFFTYDSNRFITGLVEDESINDKLEYDLDWDGEDDSVAWSLKDENKTFEDEYARGLGQDVFSQGEIWQSYDINTSPISVSLPNATSIGSSAFDGCQNLTSISIPNVTSIGGNAFYNCRSLTSISLPNVTSIGDGAFYDCWNLTSISLPNVTSIGAGAFYDCWNLTSISIPNVTSIGGNAFYNCSPLTSISLPNITYISWEVFYGSYISLISLPNVREIYAPYGFTTNSSTMVIDLSENPNFSVANEAQYREEWHLVSTQSIIFIDSPTA